MRLYILRCTPIALKKLWERNVVVISDQLVVECFSQKLTNVSILLFVLLILDQTKLPYGTKLPFIVIEKFFAILKC